jgi:mono/diheme cytochrome c family protein
MRRNLLLGQLAALMALSLATSAQGQTAPSSARPDFLGQGWSDDDRSWFYTTTQGSQLMPYDWFLALERPDSMELFLADKLARFGYLPPYLPANYKDRNPDGLPIGFVRDDDEERGAWVGMTCAACHTNQVKIGNKLLQIDGGPTNADMFAFIQELATTLEQTATIDDKFQRFAEKVRARTQPGDDERNVRDILSKLPKEAKSRFIALIAKDAAPDPAGEQKLRDVRLRRDLRRFSSRFTDFVNQSRTDVAWGPARLDAFGMIFNRATAIDLNIPENSQPPNAPVSYPFLWDTSHHDWVQWNGSAPNVLAFERLARNVGEVLGVFGQTDIRPDDRLTSADPPRYYKTSVDRLNLMLMEQRLRQLTSPAWPQDVSPIDATKAAAGKAIYDNSCIRCHAMSKPSGGDRYLEVKLISLDGIGTDPMMAENARTRRAKSGVLEGVRMPPFPGRLGGEPLAAETTSFKVTRNIVIGSILAPPDWLESSTALNKDKSYETLLRGIRARRAIKQDVGETLRVADANEIDLLARAKALKAREGEELKAQYKARPLNGIWATGPYLHNGSVPNLYEMLLPSERRSKTFQVGSREIDPKHVGFRADDGPFTFDTSLPGNSNKGHEGKMYGTELTDEQRWQVVEYLKTLQPSTEGTETSQRRLGRRQGK